MVKRVSQAEANFQLQTYLKQGFVAVKTMRSKTTYHVILQKGGEVKHYIFKSNGWLKII